MYFLYILKSLKDGKYYVGITADVDKRITYHSSGRVKSTKNRLPIKLIYSEAFENLKQARAREIYLKSYKGVGEKRKIISNTSIS
jgi:putative endonuclease